MAKMRTETPIFRKGDKVRVPFGSGTAEAEIIEDRGPVGWRGRHLFLIQIAMGPSDPVSFEVPEEELEAVGAKRPPRAMDKAKVIDYLRHGGLLAILRSNLSGGRNAPRVWLWTDPRGKVNHTFIAERGAIGGEKVPFWAIHDDRVFAPKSEEVRSFLKSFGLNDNDAAQLIESVGTVP